jgi:hypothetical protein
LWGCSGICIRIKSQIKIKENKLKKGIILQPAKIDFNSQTNSTTITGGIDQHELRKSLLYWDEIVISRNNKYHIDSTDLRLLLDQNIASEVFINLPSDNLNIYKDNLTTQLLAYQKLQEIQEKTWTIGQFVPNQLTSISNSIIEKNILEINLVNSLPCPPNDTPLFDILEFKYKHGKLIQLLQYEIEDYVDDISNSSNPERKEDRKIKEIQKIITDIQRATDRSWIENIIPSFKIGTLLSDLPRIGLAFNGGFTFAKKFGFDDFISSISGIGAAMYVAPKKSKAIKSEKFKAFESLFYMENNFPGSLKNINQENNSKITFINEHIIPDWNQPRNSSCWCASGKRFKECHGILR